MTDWVDDFFNWLIAVAFIAAIGSALVWFLMPKFFLPLVDKCHSDEDLTDCYVRVQAEKEVIKRFEDCQRTCGRGIGSELCLEDCEYTYQMGKWKYTRTFVTSTGERYECPQGQQGYENQYGRGYCQ
jgi:hypothetical protein